MNNKEKLEQAKAKYGKPFATERPLSRVTPPSQKLLALQHDSRPRILILRAIQCRK